MQIAEEEEAQAAARPSMLRPYVNDETPQQRWDCESVLSMRSNLDNHPGTISEQSNRRYKPANGKIKLAAKTGEQQAGLGLAYKGFKASSHDLTEVTDLAWKQR